MKRAAHLRALARFGKDGGDYVLIGLMAVNHYAQDASEVFITADLDILLAPRARNLNKACAAFLAQGYRLSCNGEPLGAVDDWLCRRIVERSGVVQARKQGLPGPWRADSRRRPGHAARGEAPSRPPQRQGVPDHLRSPSQDAGIGG